MNPIQAILEQHPTLNDYGFGEYGIKNTAETEASLQRDRTSLLNSTERFEATCTWILNNLQMQKTLNHKRTSYGLKHVAEHDIGYITNGLFITAMLHLHYSWEQASLGTNAVFNVSEKSLRLLEKNQQTK